MTKSEVGSEIVEAKVVDDKETAALPAPGPGVVSIYQSNDPAEQLAEAQARARILVQVIEDQGLSRSFGGQKPHVFVEGWQFLASQFGLIPDIEWSKELDTGDGWEARATLRRLIDGAEIAHAEAECRRAEGNWKDRPSYAIRSMAQTRAVSKVCRVALSSVMVMAGYAATPAEEMDGMTGSKQPPSKAPKSTPSTIADPHCPACLDQLGTLVAVTGPHDRKPYWRCTAKPEDCGGHRVYQDKHYSWSGWHQTWENSAADYRGQTIVDSPQTVAFDPTTRQNWSSHIVEEIMRLTGMASKVDAEVAVKPGLVYAIEMNEIDVEGALGSSPGDPISDDELRVIITNLTLIDAEAVIAAAVELIQGSG